MELNPEAVAAYKTLLTNPGENGFDFKPLTECFEESDIVVPQHILFNDYLAYLQKPLPKVMFYIIMQEIYPHRHGKAESGDFGYKLKLTV